MIKEFKKKTTLVDLYELRGWLEGHIFAYGRIGSGKSVSLLSTIQGFHDNFGYKILDIYGGERHEGVYWTIPSQDFSYWTKLGSIGKFDEEAPKQYKVNLLYPYFEGKLPKKLPKKSPFVTSKVFTIPLLSLIPQDAGMVIGNPSQTSKFELNELLYECNKKTNSGNILELIERGKKKQLKNTLTFKNFLLPLIRNKFLMDNYCDYNIDMKEEMKDKETITVLCLEFVPKEFHLFIINYLLRQVMDLLDANRIGKKNLIFMREASAFFKATNDSVAEDNFKKFRDILSDYLRMGRRGAYFCCDTQSAFETKGIVEGQQDFLMMFRTISYRDKEEMTMELKRARRIRPDQIIALDFLEKGQCIIVESMRNAKKVQITLPRTMYWKKEYGNFYRNVWERFGGEWTSTEGIKDYIEERCTPIHAPQVKIEGIVKSDTQISPGEVSNNPPLLGETIPLPNDIEIPVVEVIPKKVRVKSQKDLLLEEAFKKIKIVKI